MLISQIVEQKTFTCSLHCVLVLRCFPLFQMAPLEQPQVADRSVLSQRLDMPQVDLPPEESSVNLTQLVPELDLLGEKSKDKKDESDEEEVGGENCVVWYTDKCVDGHSQIIDCFCQFVLKRNNRAAG